VGAAGWASVGMWSLHWPSVERAECADHWQDSEAPIVWQRLSASPGIDAHGVGQPLVRCRIQFCLSEARQRSKSTMIPKSFNSSTSATPVEYFQTLGCVLGPASAAVIFCTGRDANVYSWSELQASRMGNGS